MNGLTLLFLLIVITVSGCAKSNSKEEMEKLVLIEFASKLEENYHRLHPESTTMVPDIKPNSN